LALLVVTVYAPVFFPNKPAYDQHVGVALADSTILDDKGAQYSLLRVVDQPPYAGKKLIFSFWATWCQPCIRELPMMAQQRARFEKDNTKLVLVNFDGPPFAKTRHEVGEWFKSNGIALTTFFDIKDTILEKYDISGLPFTMGVGRDRIIQWMRLGELDWEDQEIKVKD